MNKKSNNASFFIGALGGIIVVALFLIYLSISESYNYKSVYILNPGVQSDSLKTVEIEILKTLETRGQLLTPDQYANNIASYYNTFVAFLSILFVVFSIVSYFSLKATTKKDIEQDVEVALKDMLRDSIKFRDTVLAAIYGRVEENFVDKEDFDTTVDDLNLQINEINELLLKISNGGNPPEELE